MSEVFDGAPNVGAPLLLKESRTQSLASGVSLSRRDLRLGILSTASLWWLSIAWPFLWIAAWFALAPLLWIARDLAPQRRFWWAWKCGVASFAMLNWWIILTVASGAPMIGFPAIAGAALGAVAVMGIAMIHALQVAFAVTAWGMVRHRLPSQAPFWRSSRFWSPLVFAAFWAIGEWVRTQTVMAHGWGALAFSQWRNLPLLQSVAWIGQHGLSAFLAWTAAASVVAIEGFSRHKNSEVQTSNVGESSSPNAARKYLLLPASVLLLLHLFGAWRLHREPAFEAATVRPNRKVLRALLVQTDVSTEEKNTSGSESPLSQAMRLTLRALKELPASQKPDVILWPETTLSLLAPSLSSDAPLTGLNAVLLRDLARRTDASLLIGATISQPDANGNRVLRNDAVLVSPEGTMQRRGKTRPVPFGERALFGEILPFLTLLAPDPPVEIAPTEGPMRFKVDGKDLLLGTAICFETDFPEPSRSNARGAQLLAILSNDEWFKGTEAPREHAAMAIVRAVENRVALVQAANGGHSFAADKCGRVIIPSFLPSQSQILPNRMTSFGNAQSVMVTVPLP